MSQERFEGRVVWITGASSGIGEALARAFAAEGARLVLSARRTAELERVAASCRTRHAIEIVPIDLSAPASLAETVNAVLARVGRVDVMVHNAGISQRAKALETELATDRRVMEVNFFGVVALTKALLPAMLRQGGGRFVVVTSLTGVFGTPLRSTYAASKHALHGFFDSLRAEHHADGVRVTIVCPGFVQTQISVNAVTGDGTPLGTMDEATSKGISADACAARTLDAIAADRVEVYVGGKEVIGAYLKRLSPAAFARFLLRMKVT